jgi:hypothetical protein
MNDNKVVQPLILVTNTGHVRTDDALHDCPMILRTYVCPHCDLTHMDVMCQGLTMAVRMPPDIAEVLAGMLANPPAREATLPAVRQAIKDLGAGGAEDF